MKISAVITFRDCINHGYPFIEAILSHLPIVDEYLVNDGGSSDGTKVHLQRLAETFPKIRVFNIPDYPSERWDCVSDQYNKLIEEASGDWIIQGNADEIVHEEDLDRLRNYILDEKTADVFKLARKEVKDWKMLPEKAYWPSRVAKKIPGLHQNWNWYGGDEFLDESGWIRGEPRVKKIDILIWHFYVAFPGNRVQKRRNDAEYLAPGAKHRVEIYEKLKGKKLRYKDRVIENPIENLPALTKGLIGKGLYQVREELFDIEWLEKTTSLCYE